MLLVLIAVIGLLTWSVLGYNRLIACVGIGAVGLFGTFWFHRWARRPEHAELGRRMDDSLTGGSLRKAMAQLQEVQRFELD